MRIVAFKVEEDLLHKLDVYAINMRLSRSDVIREALYNLLNGNGNTSNAGDGKTEAEVEKVPIRIREVKSDVREERQKRARMVVRKLSPTRYELEIIEHIRISCRIRREASRAIDKLAKQLGVTKSDLIRLAISEFLKKHGVEVPL